MKHFYNTAFKKSDLKRILEKVLKKKFHKE